MGAVEGGGEGVYGSVVEEDGTVGRVVEALEQGYCGGFAAALVVLEIMMNRRDIYGGRDLRKRLRVRRTDRLRL
jgi:hypothetical protein